MLPVARILSSVRPRRWSRTTVWSCATPNWLCLVGRPFIEGSDGFGFWGEDVVAVAGGGDEGVAGGFVELGDEVGRDGGVGDFGRWCRRRWLW